jgi:hypothetical protein
MDESDEIKRVREAQSQLLNELYKAITETFNYQLQYGIVNLIERGVSVTIIGQSFGITPARIYQIVDKFRKMKAEELTITKEA